MTGFTVGLLLSSGFMVTMPRKILSEPHSDRYQSPWRAELGVPGPIPADPLAHPSRDERLEVGPHHTLYSADSGVSVHLIHGEAPRPPGLAQRLESHVQTDLVAVLEGIGDGFGDAVHAHCLAFDAVSLDAISQCLSAKAHNTEARIAQRGAAATTVECNPNLMRKLSADLMKAQCGQQADHCLRRPCGSECETVMLGHWGIGEPVASPCNPSESAGTN